MPDPEQHRSASKSRCYAIVLVLIAFCTPVAGLPAVAFAETGFASYVTPFPAKERYRLIVLGDSLAGGVATALAADLSPLGVEVTNKAANGLGLARNDTNEWDKAVETLPATDEFQIAVVLFGADDRMAIRGPKLRLDFATAGWKQDYARRVDGLLKALHNRKAAVYWLGLPVMRGDAASNAAQMMNGIFLERVRLSSASY